MARPRFHPPLNKTLRRKVDGYAIYTVDAFAVRNASQADEEFDNVATAAEYPDMIPKGEIWTARSTWKREGNFFIANALEKVKAKAAGKSKSEAVDAGNRADRQLRERTTGVKFRDGRPHSRVPNRVYDRAYCNLPDDQGPITVWLVEGLWVRGYYKTDYTEGGHGYVYRWCPRTQIWIERSIAPAERPFIIAHEYIELRLMRDEGLEYDKAHEICSEMEFDLRDAKTRAKFPGLSRKPLTKADLAKITSSEFFDFVRKNYQKSLRRRIRAVVSDLASAAHLSALAP